MFTCSPQEKIIVIINPLFFQECPIEIKVNLFFQGVLEVEWLLEGVSFWNISERLNLL